MSSYASLPKPAQPGNPVIAIANTKSAYSNVRSGPGINYQDVGDLMDNSLIVYYPGTKTPGNWVWVEKAGLRGWVYAGYIEFIPAIGAAPSPHPPTPYDGKVALWHWKGTAIPEESIQELLDNIKSRSPHVNQIWVKITEGSDWMGEFDSSALAVSGVSAIDAWVSACQGAGIEFHAWCVSHGLDAQAESAILIDACKRPGVHSLILDIEQPPGYWQGGEAGVRPFMLALRRGLGTNFHIGISVDPRKHNKAAIFPDAWSPFIDSVHPQTYWTTFRRTVEKTLSDMYAAWSGYGKPIIPALQGKAPAQEHIEAHTLATQQHGAKGLSWWRYGVISQWSAINTPIELTQSPAEESPENVENFTDEVIILPSGQGFRSGTYTGQPEFNARRNTWGWDYLHTTTEVRTSKVWAEWRDDLPKSGLYEISVFVPSRHATTRRARYKVHGIVGTDTEVVIDINQHINRNAWLPLGIFDLDRNMPNAGRVFLNDVTGEQGKSIAFDAVRFRRIVSTPPGYSPAPEPNDQPSPPPSSRRDRPSEVNGVKVADGYDAPIGTSAQRKAAQVWPPGWRDASPFGKLYFIGTPSEAYHTGADLNFGRPYQDKGMSVFACASGVVTFAARLSVWGNLIVIKHDPLFKPAGAVIYSRYAHVQNMRVVVGQRVARGERICEIGDAFRRFVPHLHFDLSPTTLFETRPGNWPKLDYDLLIRNYIDPLQWIKRNRP